jgi:asparagine synthetase B (glutamine-hydrolysing)
VFESAKIVLGLVRLKIIDLEGGQQPIAMSGDCVLAFNGEIYNHAVLRVELEELGHRFDLGATRTLCSKHSSDGMLIASIAFAVG